VCHDAGVKRAVPVVLGVVLVVVGGVWALQGLGYLAGSPMTGVAAWAIIGPLVAGLGVALVVVGARGPR
jgi:hypothetical protein